MAEASNAGAMDARELAAANESLRGEIAEGKRTEALLDGQTRVLEMVAGDAPLEESMTALVRLIEAHVPGMLGSILVLDEEGVRLRHCAAPNLPAEYTAAIDGAVIGPETGSCGTAAYSHEPVFAEDVATDPRWKNYRALALPHGLHACWSTPIMDAQRRVLGTFAMYYRQPGLPEAEHIRLIEIATHVATIALSRDCIQAALREREAKLKEAQRLAKIGYWDRDLVTGRITWSEETYRIFGRQLHGPFITQPEFQELIHPDDRRLQREAYHAALRGGPLYDVEYRVLQPDGGVRFVHARDEIRFDDSGRPVRMFGTVQDITERKQAEAQLHAQEEEIRAVVENSPDLIVRFDRQLCRTYVNPAFARVTGWSPEALLSCEIGGTARGDTAIAPPEEIANMRAALETVFDTGEPSDFESTWPSPTGRRTFTVHLEPEFDAHGGLTSVLTISRDVTELKENEQKLRQAQAELAQISRLTMMGELTASIAHEINQPLAGVVTNAQACLEWLAADPPDLPEARKAVKRIARDGQRAGDVIARVRALLEKRDPVRTPLDLNQAVRESVALVLPELKRRAITWQTGLAPQAARVQADPVQLQQVMMNLLGNALDSLSAVSDGPRELRITTEVTNPKEARVAVSDTGIGFDPRETERLFTPFFTTKRDGLGMGLAISRSIIEAHGGRLWATFNSGPGMTFQFVLPMLAEAKL